MSASVLSAVIDAQDAPIEKAAVDPVATIADAETAAVGWRDFLAMTKPRIVVMILVTTAATAVIGAAGQTIGGMNFLLLMAGTAMVAGAAGAANQIAERRIDALMNRTANRPMPGGRLKMAPAVAFAAALLMAGTALLVLTFDWVPAAFGLATFVSYVFVYTPMKTRTPWNTTVGAIAGALPVMIGYTATGGSPWGGVGWAITAVLAAWQYPHFMAIAWMYRRQYHDAGFRMTTGVHPGGGPAAFQAVAGSIATWAAAIAVIAGIVIATTNPSITTNPTITTNLLSDTSTWVGVIAVVLVTAAIYPMTAASVRFARRRDDAAARRLLRSSLWVLPAVLLVATVTSLWVK